MLAPIEVVKASLRDAIGGAIKAAGISPSDVTLIAGDTAGIGYLREGAEYVEGIISESFPGVPVYLVGDMVAGFFGALYHEWGVVATAGTGSSIYGRTEKGQGLQAGGWGHILGDEGSAYDIAVGGLRAAARAYDGRAAPTTLTGAFPKHFGLTDMIGVAITIYVDKTMTRDRIAEAARVVADQADRGDAVARSVMESARARACTGGYYGGAESGDCPRQNGSLLVGERVSGGGRYHRALFGGGQKSVSGSSDQTAADARSRRRSEDRVRETRMGL